MPSEKLDKWDAHIGKIMFDKEESYKEKKYQDHKKQIDVLAEPKQQHTKTKRYSMGDLAVAFWTL
jgi:hypothetical protein